MGHNAIIASTDEKFEVQLSMDHLPRIGEGIRILQVNDTLLVGKVVDVHHAIRVESKQWAVTTIWVERESD